MNVLSLKDEEYINNSYIIMCTKNGVFKKTRLKEYSRPRQNGVFAINVREGDALLTANLIEEKEGDEPVNIMIGAKTVKLSVSHITSFVQLVELQQVLRVLHSKRRRCYWYDYCPSRPRDSRRFRKWIRQTF